jgi:EAL domain-containing protein (putative c-di-GMP-specific phosphodiesterase class I)
MDRIPAGPATELISRDDLERVIGDPSLRRIAFQPLVDLGRGRAEGFEALARVDGPVKAPPDMWFAAAQRDGLDGPFGAAFLATALEMRSSVPSNAFLAVNVDPRSLTSVEMAASFARAGDLTGVVVELTEDVAVAGRPGVLDALKDLRSRGARIAVDDGGAGYSALEQLRTLEPGFVKLDRALVAGINRDPAKAALVEMLGQFATRIGAKLVAVGIERVEELETLIDLRIGLGQGYLLGHPEPTPQNVRELVTMHIRNHAGVRNVPGKMIDELVEHAPTLGSRASLPDAVHVFTADPALGFLPVLDSSERPIAMAVRPGGASDEPTWAGVLAVQTGSSVADAARRALDRSAQTRFHPLVCVDDVGRYRGIVPLERLVGHLAGLAQDD